MRIWRYEPVSNLNPIAVVFSPFGMYVCQYSSHDSYNRTAIFGIDLLFISRTYD
jgi:hypothetical protein